MKRVHFSTSLLLLAVIFIIQGCTAQSVRKEPQDLSSTVPQVEKKPGWEMEWDKTVSEARKEKKVVIATGQIVSVREALFQSFKNNKGP